MLLLFNNMAPRCVLLCERCVFIRRRASVVIIVLLCKVLCCVFGAYIIWSAYKNRACCYSFLLTFYSCVLDMQPELASVYLVSARFL